jgi:hypothetical protein
LDLTWGYVKSQIGLEIGRGFGFIPEDEPRIDVGTYLRNEPLS